MRTDCTSVESCFSVETDCNRVFHDLHAYKIPVDLDTALTKRLMPSTPLTAILSSTACSVKPHDERRRDHLSATGQQTHRRTVSRYRRLGGRAPQRRHVDDLSSRRSRLHAPLTTICHPTCCSHARFIALPIHADPALSPNCCRLSVPLGRRRLGNRHPQLSQSRHGAHRLRPERSRSHRRQRRRDRLRQRQHRINAYASAAWWYWNTVIIQHGEHEFSLYGHLAPDSIPRGSRTAAPPM